MDGCFNKAGRNIMCSMHRAKPCSVAGCTTKSMAYRLCRKHGAFGKCRVEHCSTNAQSRGSFCGRHGGVYGFCFADGCETPLIPGTSVCTKHGAHGICKEDGCTRNASKSKVQSE